MATTNIFDLLFILKAKDHTVFWAASPTGEYGRDCDTGSEFALECLDFVRKTGMTWILSDVAGAMPSRESRSGIEIGFMSAISHEAAFGVGSYAPWKAEVKREIAQLEAA